MPRRRLRPVSGQYHADPPRFLAGREPTAGGSGMVDLIGELPDIHAVLAIPGAYLHLYAATRTQTGTHHRLCG